MDKTEKCRRVAVVLLLYNSERDITLSAPQLAAQSDVQHTIILVDNGSSPDSLARIRAWLANWRPDAVIGSEAEVHDWVLKNQEQSRARGRVYLILAGKNHGYSVGNNIGIRLAEAVNAEAVLVANPDMRIEDPHYLSELTRHLFADESTYVAASRIVGLDGRDQSPLRELSFWEELLWPRFYLSQSQGLASHVVPVPGSEPVVVPKVSGCCLLLRISYLRAAGYLDEGVGGLKNQAQHVENERRFPCPSSQLGSSNPAFASVARS